MDFDEFGLGFLRLTLEIDKHIEGYIDAYSGPEALWSAVGRTAVVATPKRPPAALLEDVARLQGLIPQGDRGRVAYVTAVLRAAECTVRMLNGESFAYLDEVNRLFDITPQLLDEAVFTAAHGELDSLLPGAGRIAERLENHRRRYYLAKEQILPLLELAREETRRRTAVYLQQTFSDRYPLPADETVAITLTHGQPWSAYNWYQGNGRSLIEFNTDGPVSALGLLSTFAHEGYPGHHTEGVLKERYLLHKKGYVEQAVALLHSPAAVIAEGIATTAVEIIFPNETEYDWTVEVLLPAAGIQNGITADQLRRLAAATGHTRHVSGNAAILYHTGQLNQAQTIDYIQTYALSTRERAEKSFSFISHPLFRAYTFTYTQGYDLLTQAPDKTALFGRLLLEQILPSQIRAA